MLIYLKIKNNHASNNQEDYKVVPEPDKMASGAADNPTKTDMNNVQKQERDDSDYDYDKSKVIHDHEMHQDINEKEKGRDVDKKVSDSDKIAVSTTKCCELCHKTFINERNLLTHIRRFHEGKMDQIKTKKEKKTT